MEHVEYRPLRDEDIETLGAILGDTWHGYADGRKRVISGIVDFANFARRNTFAEVAIVDGSPIGVIMARAPLMSRRRRIGRTSSSVHARNLTSWAAAAQS